MADSDSERVPDQGGETIHILHSNESATLHYLCIIESWFRNSVLTTEEVLAQIDRRKTEGGKYERNG